LKNWLKKESKNYWCLVLRLQPIALETTIEIGSEYKEIFEEHGGKHLQLVESLNDHPIMD
jgi:hypothetical protein